MSKLTSIFSLCLLLCFGLIHASRPLLELNAISALHEDAAKAELEDESCEGLDGREECLMRRTLAAHVDYIYTQKQKPRN